MRDEFAKVLIFSNNCFSKTNSNGKTLSKLFNAYPKENLAQFYIQNDSPDFERCNNYFMVTDREALSSFLKKKNVGRRITESITENVKIHNNSIKKPKKRTPLTMLLREMVWNSNKWIGEDFNSWLNEFVPEVIIVQAGDNSFLLNIATKLAKERKIPLIIYNTESYYFKKKNYMKDSGLSVVFYPLFISQFRKQFKETMKYASCVIYNCEMLKEEYEKHFDLPSYVVYNSSDINNTNQTIKDKELPTISYLGNLGVGRHEPLIEIGNTLQKINPLLKLNIYGKIPNDNIRNELINCSGIEYKGFINSQEVVLIMQESDILIHAENFSPFYRDDLKYAFSTKIADCLKSGKCFFNYAPIELASTQYLLENKGACVVYNQNQLEETLIKLINNKKFREGFIANALQLAEVNHNAERNGELINNLITKVVYEGITN